MGPAQLSPELCHPEIPPPRPALTKMVLRHSVSAATSTAGSSAPQGLVPSWTCSLWTSAVKGPSSSAPQHLFYKGSGQFP